MFLPLVISFLVFICVLTYLSFQDTREEEEQENAEKELMERKLADALRLQELLEEGEQKTKELEERVRELEEKQARND